MHPDGSVTGWLNKGAFPGDNPVKVQLEDSGLVAGFTPGAGSHGSRVTFADIDGDRRADVSPSLLEWRFLFLFISSY